MQVRVKKFEVNMDVKSNGIEFEIRKPDGATQIGDCYLTMTGLVWCKGRTTKQHGVKISWEDLQTVLTSKASKDAAVRAAGRV